MASGMVRSAVSSLLSDSKFSEHSERWKVAKQQVTDFMADICDEKRPAELDNFAVTLIELLDNTITLSSKGKCRLKVSSGKRLGYIFTG